MLASETLEIKLEVIPGNYPIIYDNGTIVSIKDPIGKVMFDDQILFTGGLQIDEELTFNVSANADKEHIIGVSLLNKNNDTRTDEAGNIIDDLYIKIASLKINGIIMTYDILNKFCVYELDNNVIFKGQNINKIDGFHDYLSWNGTWKFKFKSPFYLWLLDNL